MKRHISFGSIEQFRNTVKSVKDYCYFNSIGIPKVKAVATEKLHGTNASICFSSSDGLWAQKRNDICTVENDNAGFALFVEKTKESCMDIIKKLAEYHKIDFNKNIISVYGEWCGGNIQKNSCASGLDKRFVIFQYFKVSSIEPSEDDESYWLETKTTEDYIDNKESNIFNVMNSKYWEIDIDFNNPAIAQNQLAELVEKEIEPNSPIGCYMGKEDNIGEGVVVQFMLNDILKRYKVKGEKHSSTKVKTLKVIDTKRELEKIEFANYCCKPFRLEQAYQLTFDTLNGGKGDIKKTGDFIRNVISDCMKEETDIIIEKNLEWKQVNGMISKIARTWLIEQLDNEIIN